MIFSDLWGIAQEMRMQNKEKCLHSIWCNLYCQLLHLGFLVCFMVFKWVQSCDFI